MNGNNTPQVFFVEGIQGSGKSTFAKALASQLRRESPEARIHMRSASPNPIDICRLAFFTSEEYTQFLSLLSEISGRSGPLAATDAAPYTSREREQILVNWYDCLSRWGQPTSRAAIFSLDRELCDGKTNPRYYQEVTFRRWSDFARTLDSGDIYIFEGALLQHPLAEMMGYYMLSDDEIEEFLLSLVNCLRNIPTSLYYISVTDVKKVLSATAEARQGENWLQGFLKMTTTCTYGMRHGFSGMSGAIEYSQERIRIENKILKKLNIPVMVVERN